MCTAAAQLFPALSRAGNKDYHGLNSVRLAEVWLDDYKRLFYMQRHDLLVSLLVYSSSYTRLRLLVYSYSVLYSYSTPHYLSRTRTERNGTAAYSMHEYECTSTGKSS